MNTPETSGAPSALNYFTAFLHGLGLPVTEANLNALYGVAQLEGWNNRYNPLNVIQPEPGSTSFNSVGVQSYADFNSGVRGAVTLFSNSHWAGVRAALAQGNNAQGVLNAFKQAYTWDPGVQFPMGNATWGNKMIGGGSGGSDWVGPPMQTDGSSGGSGGGGGGAADFKSVLAQDLGVNSLGTLLSQVPALKQLVNEAQAGNWSIERFTNAVESSPWFKNNSQTARAILVERANDPATFNQTLHNTESSVAALSRQLGMNLTPQQLAGSANSALLTGNDGNQQWITGQISKKEDYSDLTSLKGLRGGMAATVQQLQQMAADYGFNWTPAQTAMHAQDVLDGTTTIDTYRQHLMTWAESTFPSLAKQIQGGTTVRALASPYVSSMSNLLEIDPGKLDVYTPMIRQALQGTAQPGTQGGQLQATPLWQFEQQVRNDPRWQYTQNAHDTVSSALVRVGSDFGFGPQG